jgi:hypothetical protein
MIDPVQMRILIDHHEQDDPKTIDHVDRQLVNDLARAGMAVRPASATPPGGAKGDALSLAELVMTGGLSAATVTAVATIVVSFVQRGAARRLIMRDGDREIEVAGPSTQDVRAAVEAFLRRSAEAGTGLEATSESPAGGGPARG